MIFIKKESVSYRVALGGIVSSLCLLAMFLSGIIPAMYIAFPMIAGALMMIIVSEIDWQWACLTYLAVSFLSIFITFDKQAALVFIILFGHYPITKYHLDKIKFKPIINILKFIVWNVCIFLYFFLCVYLLGSKELVKEVTKHGWIGVIGLIALVDIIYLFFDSSLGNMMIVYKNKIKNKIS